MEDLQFYFEMGWQHIMALDALDHLLFILVLTAIYRLNNWKQVLVLVTAFTIGHSLTLALSVYEIIRVSSRLVEFLIPCTIIATALFNAFQRLDSGKKLRLNYFLALFFGLIHGLGFANAIRFMLASDQHIGWALFGFNLGLEAGQIVVVTSILMVCYIVVDKAAIAQKWWVRILSSVSAMMAIWMAIQRWPW